MKKWFNITWILLLTSLLSVWFNQASIERYWQQTYHEPSPIAALSEQAWWAEGAKLQALLNEKLDFLAFNNGAESAADNAGDEGLDDADLAQDDADLAQDNGNGDQDAADSTEDQAPAQDSNTASGPVQSLVLLHIGPVEPDWRQLLLSLPPVDVTPTTEATATTTAKAASVGPNATEKTASQAEQPVQPTNTASQAQSASTQTQPATSTATADQSKPTASNAASTASEANQPAQAAASTESNLAPEDVPSPQTDIVYLHKKDMVLFVGDSLMQGVAPHLQQWLRKTYHISSLNFAKQSTGLSYPSSYDWPKTIDELLEKYSQTKLLIVLLGPNDPWDFPNPKHPSWPYLKFMSKPWEKVYLSRVDHILKACQDHGVQVIWIGIPYVKRKKLNRQMLYLNALIHNHVDGRVIWVPTRQALSGGQDHFVDSVVVKGKLVRMRSKDGTHFTYQGAELISNLVKPYIQLVP